jgi:peroxiredoxin
MQRASNGQTDESQMDPHVLLSDWLRTTFPAGPPSPARVPPFLLPDHEGWLLCSKELQAQGPYLLTFFHGSWCPKCVRKLSFLETGLDRILQLGADVVACSPETDGYPRALKANNALRFRILSDVDCTLSSNLGLAFAVPDQIRRHFDELQIDLGARHGDSRWMLPIPTALVIDRNGFVAKVFVDADGRIDLDGVVEALLALR